MEQLGNITKWLPHYRPRTPDMVVNIEWPGFQVLSFAPAGINGCVTRGPAKSSIFHLFECLACGMQQRPNAHAYPAA